MLDKPLDRAEAERIVAALYRAMLRREPDPEGAKAYVNSLVAGNHTYTSLIQSFLGSAEFSSHLGLFVPPGHFYSPIVDVSEAREHLQRLAAKSLPSSLPGIDIDRPAMVALWREMLPHVAAFPFPENATPEFRFKCDNPSYGWADAAVLYTMLKRLRPRRMIEVGSGWTSACTLDTFEREHIDCAITFIEPHAALLRERAAHKGDKLDIVEQPVQRVALSTFEALQSGDILFIDSTHVMRTASDVCHELFEILPRLARGVVVHFHDIFWPFEYPGPWTLDDNRSWNEVYALRAFLTRNADWKILFFNDYMAKLERALLEETCPRFCSNPGGAIWLVRT